MMLIGMVCTLLIGLPVSTTHGSTEAPTMAATPSPTPVSATLDAYVADRLSEFDRIGDERRAELATLADYVRSKRDANEPCRLTFVCTHNSRRSHLSMIWAAVAASHFGVDNVSTYSGGTEATAFNPRAVAAVRRAGMTVEQTTPEPNPIYHVRFAEDRPALTCFSKVYDVAPNPSEAFAAIMVCGHADENCPVVFGVEMRCAIRYVDPKVSDNTDAEAATYDERCAQIAREMLYAFSLLDD